MNKLLQFSAFYVMSFMLIGCSRGPQTALEAKAAMPRAFAGKFKFEGEAAARTVRVSTDSLRVRDEHTLEFETVHFYLINPLDDSILTDEIVSARGAITIPGGEVRLEDLGPDLRAGVQRASFTGKLAEDCQGAEASWQMDGRPASLKLRAVK